MIALAASALVVLVVVCARIRGRRLAARHAASDRIEARVTGLAHARADRLAGQLAATSERLVSCELDRDALQLVAAGHLRRAWRAERALTAVRARDEEAAYWEAAERGHFPQLRPADAPAGLVFEPIFDGPPSFPGGAS